MTASTLPADPARWSEVAGSLGYGTRPLPAPVHLPVHLTALVPPEQGRDVIDLAARPVPLLGIAAGGTAAAAAQRAAELAAGLRHTGGDRAERSSAGCGPDGASALLRALLAEVLAQALPRLDAGRWCPLTDWQAAADPGTRDLLAALGRIGARVDAWLVEGVAPVPTVAAVLVLPAAPHAVRGAACHLDPDRAAGAAVWRAVEALAVALLAGSPGEPVDVPGPVGAPRPAGAPAADPTAGSDLARLRAALRASGRTARHRPLPGPASAVAVEAQVLPAPATRGTGPWAPPDVCALGLDAPAQLGFSYEPRRAELSRLYHEHSKIGTLYRDMPPVELSRMAPALQRLLATPVRDHRYAVRRYLLPRDRAARTRPVEECIAGRRSWAAMDAGPLTQADLGHLLHFTCGVTGSAGLQGTDVHIPMRATPAAGGLYSTDLFLYVQRVEGVAPGLYYYDPRRHELQSVRDDVPADEVVAHVGYPERAADAAALVVHVASLRRLRWKYWERSYRMAHLDSGHLAQSLVLVAGGLGLVAHPMIAFVDDFFNELVGVDGLDEAAVYLTLLAPRARGAA
ncbi:SagB family peptide dehydrogenase [Geodermatophilus sp. SYSU D01186]